MAHRSPHNKGIVANEGTVMIRCSFDELRDVESLTPNPRNPNRHSDDQIARLARVILHQGFRRPIVVSARSGFVISGHGRLAAALLLGMSKVPVDVQAYEDEATEWADMVADNRLAELAEIDTDALTGLLDDIDGDGFDTLLTGFTPEELDAALTAAAAAGEQNPAPAADGADDDDDDAADAEDAADDAADDTEAPEDFPEVGEGVITTHKCPKCDYEWSGNASK